VDVIRIKDQCLVLAVFLLLSVSAFAGEWELVKDEDDIRVYTRTVEGSDYKAFRGESIVNAELNQVMALLDDTSGFVHWMFKCKSPKLLYKVSLMDRYQYLQNDFPWPAADREMILRNEIYQDTVTRVTTVKLSGVKADALPESAQATLPTKTNAVRVDEVAGFFELTPLSDTQTKVVFQLHLNPVGALPASLVNSMIVDNPFETLKAMRIRVALPEYANFNPF
jgi:hypothetical protein